jgi:hypothetical protein
MRNVEERFSDLYHPEPNSGCWIWIGNCNKGGYGFFRYNNKTSYAHRVSYLLFRDIIPKGFQIDHLCRTRCCVNPDHLEVVTPQENIRRGNTGLRNKKKTHCPLGHEYKEGNIYIVKGKNGNLWRQCKTCKAASDSRVWRKRKELNNESNYSS